MSEEDDKDTAEARSATPVNPRARFTMKSLGALVDSNRIKASSTRDTPVSEGPRARVEAEPDPELDAGDDAAEAIEPPGEVEADAAVDADFGIEPPPAASTARPRRGAHNPAKVREHLPSMRTLSRATRSGGAAIELRDGAADAPVDRASPDETSTDLAQDDGVDRSNLGTAVTRTGLDGLVGATADYDGSTPAAGTSVRVSEQPLARQMLDEEIAPGGRLSDPRDVPGIVLGLAKELPAAAAVSVVRIDEEIELVGNTIDPDVDPSMLASVFSGVFRTMQVAAGVLADGPLGTVHDVVIEGEHMDLVLRPLGPHFYLMVLEDRRSPSANLNATRLRMATLAPGLAAILAHENGDA